tara:strand:+ start:1441 stop:1566 length:126 start_codon:yes stop_codon:yes gene_type:complete
MKKIKILICDECGELIETTAKKHTHRCCGHRMLIVKWRLEE